jgi:hypothetical protein
MEAQMSKEYTVERVRPDCYWIMKNGARVAFACRLGSSQSKEWGIWQDMEDARPMTCASFKTPTAAAKWCADNQVG